MSTLGDHITRPVHWRGSLRWGGTPLGGAKSPPRNVHAPPSGRWVRTAEQDPDREARTKRLREAMAEGRKAAAPSSPQGGVTPKGGVSSDDKVVEPMTHEKVIESIYGHAGTLLNDDFAAQDEGKAVVASYQLYPKPA